MNFLTKKQKQALRDAVFRFSYVLKNWKQIIHLAFGTKSFGVNNAFFSSDHSLFEKKGFGKILGVFERISMMKARAFMGFIPIGDAIRLFPGYASKHGYDKKGKSE